MVTKSTIRAFQKVLKTFDFQKPTSFSEDFAQKRFLKKFQEPSDDLQKTLQTACWEEWLENDQNLPEIDGVPHDPGFIGPQRFRCRLSSPEWYKARDFLHRSLSRVSFGPVSFPKGSEFHPTRGNNSIEAKLSASRWTCTHENFEAFSKLCYNHSALKRAARKKYSYWFTKCDFDITEAESDRFLYKRFHQSGSKRIGFDIFVWKLERVVTFTQGSRFSTVPKNNESVRPINVEPFGNILVQKQVGDWIRAQIGNLFGYNLDTLADVHRLRIRDVDTISTIDLKNASDSISLELCRFLLPQRLYRLLLSCRCDFILGPDGSYHQVKKISSMGNGFTFELMSLILASICRVLDPAASVFGDDIIINTDKAGRLIELLSEVGLKVNVEKSFTSGPFRESCGGNYHRDEGYVESYDFEWPTSIGDVVIIWNKVVRLSKIYPSFLRMYHALYRTIPAALHGGRDPSFEHCDMLELVGLSSKSEEPLVRFPQFFVTKRPAKSSKTLPVHITKALQSIQQNVEEFSFVPGFEFKPKLRSPTRIHLCPKRNWAKYEMYLASNRKAKDVISDSGEWVRIWFVKSDFQSYRAGNLVT